MKDVMILTGAGQIGMAIARRMGYGKKIVVGDKSLEKAQAAADSMKDTGFDTAAVEIDLSSRSEEHTSELPSPSWSSDSGSRGCKGGAGVTISSQSGWRMPALTPEEDELLAVTPAEELLGLPMLQPENIRDTLHAYQMAKRCNEKRVMAEAVKWGRRRARINDIAPGIIVTPLAVDEFSGPRGDFYKNMFANCPAGRPGTPDEVANVAELLMSEKGVFITGSTVLIDGGATASYFYGPLHPGKNPSVF